MTITLEADFHGQRALDLFQMDQERYLETAVVLATNQVVGWFSPGAEVSVSATATAEGFSASHREETP